MNQQSAWYTQLKKPAWAPPSWLFGPVWSFLYLLIAGSFGFVFWQILTGQWPWPVAMPFALNLVFNFAFTPLQFRLKSNALAAVDIVLVLATLVWAMAAVWPYAQWVALIQLPYLLWVAFATLLQLTITFLNAK
jgi:tryptophan-rich sensory protein